MRGPDISLSSRKNQMTMKMKMKKSSLHESTLTEYLPGKKKLKKRLFGKRLKDSLAGKKMRMLLCLKVSLEERELERTKLSYQMTQAIDSNLDYFYFIKRL